MRWIACSILVLAIASLSHAQSGRIDGGASGGHFPRYTRPNPEAGPTPVNVAFWVLDLKGITDVDQTVMADFFLEIGWRDPRLAQPDNAGRGELRPINIDGLWHPFVQVVNQVRLFRQLPEEVLVDDEGNCVYRQRYVGTLSVPLHLADFPFDRQTLSIQLVSVMNTPREVSFSLDEALTGRAEEFTIVDWEVGPAAFEVAPYRLRPGGIAMSGIRASFSIRRYANYFILKVITPLVVIVAMSWVVFWIDPKQLGPRVGVGTTSVLTLIAYRFLLGSLVPRVSYLTRLDIFILGATVLVFLALVEAIATWTQSTQVDDERPKRVNWWSRIVFPISLCVLLVMSFL